MPPLHALLPAITTETATPARSALCTAAALYLMSHYAQRPCPLVAHAVAGQLAILSHDGSNGASHNLHALAVALLPRWQTIASGGTTGIRH